MRSGWQRLRAEYCWKRKQTLEALTSSQLQSLEALVWEHEEQEKQHQHRAQLACNFEAQEGRQVPDSDSETWRRELSRQQFKEFVRTCKRQEKEVLQLERSLVRELQQRFVQFMQGRLEKPRQRTCQLGVAGSGTAATKEAEGPWRPDGSQASPKSPPSKRPLAAAEGELASAVRPSADQLTPRPTSPQCPSGQEKAETAPTGLLHRTSMVQPEPQAPRQPTATAPLPRPEPATAAPGAGMGQQPQQQQRPPTPIRIRLGVLTPTRPQEQRLQPPEDPPGSPGAPRQQQPDPRDRRGRQLEQVQIAHRGFAAHSRQPLQPLQVQQ
ncbi:hypothetical protein GPECTOR_23g130 [Gonium pectorale]|uniref:Uncharacterized protein n=1 Tax=Gonium pectorale TaxID=33097 RepID=A0A150GGU4_GONPE|nr:hypothetical protein GPECTOR_23g130 [Gonium pectorale]|eukprot:KXZ49044.1 hypothetical protein GPECTOR_23g130 [Gonium pectorale]